MSSSSSFQIFKSSSPLLPLAVALACAWGQEVDGVKEEEKGLFAQVAISPTEARRLAEERVPNGTIDEAELEMEEGRLVYSFEFKVSGQRGETEIHIDAKTGEVITLERDD